MINAKKEDKKDLDDDDDEENYNLVKKELDLLEPSLNEYLGNEHDCQFFQKLDESELARNHLETLLE